MSEVIKATKIKHLPLLALRGLAVFPGMLLTFDVERPASLSALNNAMQADQLIFLAAQKDLRTDMPEQKDIWHVGTVCRIRQQLRQPRSKICRVMVEGLYRAEHQHGSGVLYRSGQPLSRSARPGQRGAPGGHASQLPVAV